MLPCQKTIGRGSALQIEKYEAPSEGCFRDEANLTDFPFGKLS
jgi:hypothetical protein